MKMEGIELYPHNQKAYDNLCAMLRDSNRACVVQPTGTGKFVIIAKMAQDNPGKNFLLLGTNDYMFIDQMGNEEHECASSEERECARETSLSPAQGNRLRLLMLCGL